MRIVHLYQEWNQIKENIKSIFEAKVIDKINWLQTPILCYFRIYLLGCYIKSIKLRELKVVWIGGYIVVREGFIA